MTSDTEVAPLEGLESMQLDQAEKLAQAWKMREPFKVCKFDLFGPTGRKDAQWLDAYYGFFTVEGVDGFLRTQSFEGELVWVENMRLEDSQ